MTAVQPICHESADIRTVLDARCVTAPSAHFVKSHLIKNWQLDEVAAAEGMLERLETSVGKLLESLISFRPTCIVQEYFGEARILPWIVHDFQYIHCLLLRNAYDDSEEDAARRNEWYQPKKNEHDSMAQRLRARYNKNQQVQYGQWCQLAMSKLTNALLYASRTVGILMPDVQPLLFDTEIQYAETVQFGSLDEDQQERYADFELKGVPLSARRTCGLWQHPYSQRLQTWGAIEPLDRWGVSTPTCLHVSPELGIQGYVPFMITTKKETIRLLLPYDRLAACLDNYSRKRQSPEQQLEADLAAVRQSAEQQEFISPPAREQWIREASQEPRHRHVAAINNLFPRFILRLREAGAIVGYPPAQPVMLHMIRRLQAQQG